jgi:hypothetical protein
MGAMASMSHNGQKRLLNNIVSPYGLAMFSYTLFLLACLIPPSLYSHFMMEPDLMFLDPATILFYTLCVAGFVAGVWLVGWLFPASFVDHGFRPRQSPTLFLMVPLTFGIVLTAVSLTSLIVNNPSIIVWLLTQQGGNLKTADALDANGNLTIAPLTLTAIVWWAFWRYSDLGLQGWRRRLVSLGLFVGVLLVIASATFIVSRNLLMLVVCGLAILYVLRRTLKPVGWGPIFKSGIAFAICVILLFFGFSFLRGTSSWDDQVRGLTGYTAASYNRLAAIVNGSMRYPFGGHGVYLSSFVSYSHALNRIIPLDRIMNWPEYIEVWGSEFGAVDRAGLNGGEIWSGAFGYIFADLGWFSPIFVFGYGMLYGVVWNWMKRGRVLGIVLYPGFGFCILFWLGLNYLLDSQLVFLLPVAIMLSIYERACAVPSKIGAVAKDSSV